MSYTATETALAEPQTADKATTLSGGTVHLQSASESLPERLDERFKDYPKLSREQCGHLRHFHNLASRLDGDMSLMGAQETGQEWDTAYRYQLSHMTYAAGAAHYHRLPAMRSMFKSLIRNLIGKMMRREVWSYWYLTSQSGIRLDPDLKELRKPWADPVCKENIMYSGHLLCMISLYSMLFNDNTFDEPDAIVFDWNPMFFGMGPERFTYTRSTLQEVIIKQMERENWLGVCCEPNAIFIICNQFPLIAMRYNDAINNTTVADEVVAKYRAAWAEKGMMSENGSGLFRRWYAPNQGKTLDADQISHTAWAMTFMPWNYDVVQSMYPSTGSGYLHRVDNRINVHPPVVTKAIKDLAATEGADPDSPSTVARAREMTAGKKPSDSPLPYLSPTFGYISMWLSEIAGSPDLDALLRHADTYLNPSWSDGGFYYTRCDEGWDADGNYIHMEPYSGNAAIGYARLNVKNGQKKMWDHPWTREEVENRPHIDGVGFEHNVDCLRGGWYEEEKALVATFRTWNGKTSVISPVVKSLPLGAYGVYVDGELREVKDVTSKDAHITVELDVGEEELDLVVLRA